MGNFLSSNFTEWESNGNRNKTLATEENFNEIRPNLKNIIKDRTKCRIWKIQLTIGINFMKIS